MADESQPTFEERALGAIVGLFVGEALGAGCHWEYNNDKFAEKYGEVTDYLAPRDDSYHPGLKAGQYLQSGEICRLLVESLAATEGAEYDDADFLARFDAFLTTLDGTRTGGRYTSRDICDVYKARVEKGLELAGGACASAAGDTTDSFIRSAVLSVRYADDAARAADTCITHVSSQLSDPLVQTQSMAFGAVIGELVRGAPFDENIGGKLYGHVRARRLPFAHALSPEERAAGMEDVSDRLPEPDAVIWPGQIAAGVKYVTIEPPCRVADVFGKPCAFYLVLPAVYYLAARFQGDFETAVLAAVNGGGQNASRASLTGCICGAVGDIQSIPQRFIDGLEGGAELVDAVRTVLSASGVAARVEANGPSGAQPKTAMGI